MSKYDAFGTTLEMGIRQVETAVIVGTIVNPGNATITLTFAGMAGSGVPFNVAVAAADTADIVAAKIVTVMLADADITAVMTVVANGATIVMTALNAAADDGTFNLEYTNGTCTGLTPDATSNNTVAGVALATIAQVTNIGGPALSLDTEDVTTHDSPAAFEEVVATILRTGDMSLDLVYDPADNSHDYAGGLGLLKRLDDKQIGQFVITFPDAGNTEWTFDAFVTSFEPGAPHDGALTASVSLKINGEPELA